jgi:hypothetical protein
MTIALPFSNQIQKILRSPSTFSVASALAWQGFGLLTFMVLARLLSVSEMGVWAIWISLLTIADMPRQGFTQNGLVKFALPPSQRLGGTWLSAALVLNGFAALVLGSDFGNYTLYQFWACSPCQNFAIWLPMRCLSCCCKA